MQQSYSLTTYCMLRGPKGAKENPDSVAKSNAVQKDVQNVASLRG